MGDQDSTQVSSRPARLRVDFAYRLSRYQIARRQARPRDDHGEAVASWKAYSDWRCNALRSQYLQFFDGSAQGKDVLDFGCGDGSLCFVLMDAGARSAHGVDMDETGLARCAERLAHHEGERRPTFACSTVPSRIDLRDASFDAIYCLDVLEHIIDYEPIINEWHRILRPGGSVYIWWQPYWHPFGHHSYTWIPIPWAHVFLNGEEMGEVCARIVDWDGFDAPIWDRNPDGTKKNRFRKSRRDAGAEGREAPKSGGYLNQLTVHEFEACCATAGFRLARRDFIPFGWQPAKAFSQTLTKIPHIRDYFMACAVYELDKCTPMSPP